MGNEISTMIYFILFGAIIFISAGYFITDTAGNYDVTSAENFTTLTKLNQTIEILEPAKGAFVNSTSTSSSPLDYASAVANGVLAAGKLMFSVPDQMSAMVSVGLEAVPLESSVSSSVQTAVFWILVFAVLVGLFFFVRWGQL